MAARARFGRAATVLSGEWECEECGFVQRGVVSHRPRRCPDCQASYQAFSFWPDEEDDEWDDDWRDR